MKMKQFRFFTGLWFAFVAMGVVVSPGQLLWAQDSQGCGSTPPGAVVDEVTESVLTPVQQAAAVPADLYEQILVLTSESLASQWVDAGGEVTIDATASAPATVLTISASAKVVSVAFWDSTGETTRYGYGIQSEVTINPGNGGPISHSSGFKLAKETANPTEAIDGATEFTETLAQNASGIGGIGSIGGVYSICVKACLTNAFNTAWGALGDCAGLVGEAAFVAAGVCARACFLAGPGWLACLELAAVGGAVISVACIAGFLAVLTASIPFCILGCIGV